MKGIMRLNRGIATYAMMRKKSHIGFFRLHQKNSIRIGKFLQLIIQFFLSFSYPCPNLPVQAAEKYFYGKVIEKTAAMIYKIVMSELN
jgi:hypothetical protein